MPGPGRHRAGLLGLGADIAHASAPAGFTRVVALSRRGDRDASHLRDGSGDPGARSVWHRYAQQSNRAGTLRDIEPLHRRVGFHVNRSALRPGPAVLRPSSPVRSGWLLANGPGGRVLGACLLAAQSAPGSKRQQRKQRKAAGYEHTPVPAWAGTTLVGLSHAANRRSSLPTVRPPASERSSYVLGALRDCGCSAASATDDGGCVLVPGDLARPVKVVVVADVVAGEAGDRDGAPFAVGGCEFNCVLGGRGSCSGSR